MNCCVLFICYLVDYCYYFIILGSVKHFVTFLYKYRYYRVMIMLFGSFCSDTGLPWGLTCCGHKKCENHCIKWSPVPWAFSWWSASFMPHLFCMFSAPFSVIRKLNQCAVVLVQIVLVQIGMPAMCGLHSLSAFFFSMPGYILGRSSEPDWACLILHVLSHFLLAAWWCVRGQPLRCAPDVQSWGRECVMYCSQ